VTMQNFAKKQVHTVSRTKGLDLRVIARAFFIDRRESAGDRSRECKAQTPATSENTVIVIASGGKSFEIEAR
jgi:hypothetical protein